MTPIAPLITAFLREHMPIERGYSPHTCETYAHAFRCCSYLPESIWVNALLSSVSSKLMPLWCST